MSERAIEDVYGDIVTGRAVSENEWRLLIERSRVMVGPTVARVIQPPVIPPGYRFDFAKLSRFGVVVHADETPKDAHALLVKFSHTDDAARPKLAARAHDLAEYIRCQDATADALCSLLDEDTDTQFIMEPYSTAGSAWTPEYRNVLNNVSSQSKARRARTIPVAHMQQVLQSQHGQMAFRCLDAGERFAAYALEKKQEHRILPGRPSQSRVDYPMHVFTDLAKRGSVSDAEIQEAINQWTSIRLKDDVLRHRFVQQQAAVAAASGKRLVVLYGTTHTDKGTSYFHSVPPIDAYLSETHQVSVLQPYGSDAPPTSGVVTLENMTVDLMRKAIPGLQR